MKYAINITALLICFFAVTSCGTIAGVSESDSESTLTPSDSSFPYDQYIVGKPNQDMTLYGGFYIWKTGNSWHVRMAQKVDRPKLLQSVWPVITGSIKVENALTLDLKEQDLGAFDKVIYRRDTISFKFELREGFSHDIEGFDFKVQPKGPEYCITLDLMVDGIPRPGIVHLGSYMNLPESLPLTICLRSERESPRGKPRYK